MNFLRVIDSTEKELAASRAREERLMRALKEIPDWLCDKELCGHYLAEEIRDLARTAIAEAEEIDG